MLKNALQIKRLGLLFEKPLKIKFMRRKIFKHANYVSIGLAILILAFAATVFGQKSSAKQKCAETDFDCLIAKYEKEKNSNLKAAEAYFKRGNMYFSSLRYDQAMADYDRAISLNPKFEDAYYARGRIYIKSRLYGSAIREFNRVKEINPKNSDANAGLAWIFDEIKKGALSIEEYEDLIQLDPTNAKYYYTRAQMYFKRENYEKAIDDSAKAVELNPKYTEAYGIRSNSFCKIGKWKESTADIKTYEKLTGKSSHAVCYMHLDLSLKHCVETDDDCKMEIYNNGINNPKLIATPGLGDYYAGRGIIYFENGDLDRAFSDFENAEKHSYKKLDERIELYLGKKLFIKGKLDEALKHFIAASTAKKESAEAFLGIGEIYLIKKEFDNALENYEKAIFLNPRLSKAYLGRGTIYLEFGRTYEKVERDTVKSAKAYKSAVKDFDSVTELDLKEINPEVYLRRAKAFEKLGESEKAAADRKKYEELSQKP